MTLEMNSKKIKNINIIQSLAKEGIILLKREERKNEGL